MPKVGTAFVSIRARLDQLEKDLKDAKGVVTKHANDTQRAVSNAFKATIAYFGVSQIKAFGQEIFAAGRQVAQLEKAFTSITGSTAAANNEFAFLRKVSDDLGQNFYDLADSYKSLMAASKNTALEGRGMRQVFLGITQAGATLGLSADAVSGALKAVEQMISKGKVSAEELRQQLGERLPGAFNLAAEAMGVSTAELDKMLKKGSVLAEDLLPKLGDLLQKRYAGSADAATAASNKLSESWLDFKNAIADSGFLTAAVAGVNALTSALETMANVFEPGKLGKAQEFFRSGLMTSEQYKKFLDANSAERQRLLDAAAIGQPLAPHEAWRLGTRPEAPGAAPVPVKIFSEDEIKEVDRALETMFGNLDDRLDHLDDFLDNFYTGLDRDEKKIYQVDKALESFFKNMDDGPSHVDEYLDYFFEGLDRQEKYLKDHYQEAINITQHTAEAMQDAFGVYFFDVMRGEMRSFADYFDGFLQAVQRSLAQIFAQNLIGTNSSGGLTGLLPMIGSAIVGMLGGISWGGGSAPMGSTVMTMAEGGVISEPVYGIGKSGRGYVIGEGGEDEYVVPKSKMGGGGLTVHVHQTNNVNAIDTAGASEVIRRCGPAVADTIVRELKHSPQLTSFFRA